MSLRHENGLQALLARFERENGDTLRRRREEASAQAPFIQHFGELCRETVRPFLEQAANALSSRGLSAYSSQCIACGDDVGLVEESLILEIPENERCIRNPQRPQHGSTHQSADDARGFRGNREDEPGIRLVADGATRQVQLQVRTLRRPETLHMSELPPLEQWTAERIEADLLVALEQVLLDDYLPFIKEALRPSDEERDAIDR